MRTIRSSGIYKNKSKIGFMDLIRILMIPCETFLRFHLKIIGIIALIVSFRVRVDGHGGDL